MDEGDGIVEDTHLDNGRFRSVWLSASSSTDLGMVCYQVVMYNGSGASLTCHGVEGIVCSVYALCLRVRMKKVEE